MGGPWIVHEGYLQYKPEADASPRAVAASALRGGRPAPLVDRYVVLSMNRKLEFFDGADPDARARVDAAHLVGFCGWDGDGLLKADAYGLELKVDKRRAGPRMFLAAFNRLDLEKWCRAFVAVLDPDSAAGQEVRRERRRARKEEKRLEEEREEKIRKWKEKKARALEEERQRLLAREEEISNMTPLERVDGLGSLDDDTARVLEKRKLRLQRRQAPTTGRVNKAAYRRRIEEAAGGKTDNVQPLQTKLVEQKYKVRVELPPPGQFIIAADAPHRHRSASSGSGSLSDEGSERSSVSSRLSSGSSRHKHQSGNDRRFSMGGIPPPPPPPSQSMRRLSIASSSTSQFVPPPPPFPPPLSVRSSFDDVDRFGGDSRPSRSSSSFRSSSFDTMSLDHPPPRASTSQGRARASNADKFDIQSSLAAIMGGGRRPSSRSTPKTRRDSFESTASSVANGGAAFHRRSSRAKDASSPSSQGPTMANAFAASLAAIRRNRADTVDEGDDAASPVSVSSRKTRSRKRDSQLSAEGKTLLKKAIEGEDASGTSNGVKKAQSGRKGLFDDSSEDDDDGGDSGLFGASTRDKTAAAHRSDDGGRRSVATTNGAGRESAGRRVEDDLSGSDSDASADSRSTTGLGTSLFARRSGAGGPTSPKSAASSTSGFVSATAPSRDVPVSVSFVSSAVQSVGKKLDGVFTFAFHAGPSAEHSFAFTYSQFEEIHTRLASAFASTTLPKFPSKHRLRNNTKPENMQKRAQEFLEYLQQLVAVPGMASSSRFQFEYKIEGPFARALLGESLAANGAAESTANGSAKKRSDTATVSPASSSGQSPAARPKKTPKRVKKQLFGSSDDDSDSDSDTSINTPESSSLHERQAAPVSSRRPPPSSKHLSGERRRRHLDASQASSHNFSVAGDAPRRRKSRASSRASHIGSAAAPPSPEAPSKIPKVTGLPPNRPNPFAGGRGDLLAAIRKGAELKKVGASEADGSASTPGAPSAPPRPPPPAPMTQATSISEAITNAMAARRIHVEYEETHSDANDSDDDWDD